MRALRLIIVAAATAATLSACLGGSAPSAAVGDCLNISDLGTEVQELPTVPCEEPHEGEVYAVFDLTHEGDYSEDAVETETDETCTEQFATFVGVDWLESELHLSYLYPEAEGWADGDREAICVVYEPDWETGEIIEVEGSLEGAAR